MADRGDVMVTRSGREIHCRGVSRLVMEGIAGAVRREFQERDEPIEPPQIEMTTVSGDVERIAVTASMIEKNAKLKAEFGEQWAAHVEAAGRMAQQISQRQGEYMLANGIVLPPDYKQDGWKQRLSRYGIQVAEDEEDRRKQFILSELLQTTEDEYEAGVRISALTYGAIDQEGVEKALEMFRAPIRQRVGHTLDEAARQQEPVVASASVHGGEGGATLGPDTEPVQETGPGGSQPDDGQADSRGNHADVRAGSQPAQARARKSKVSNAAV